MDSIVYFNSEKEYSTFIQKKICKELGSGSEGTCYLGKDGLAYKNFLDGFVNNDYVLENIITSNMCDNASFNFPHVLFAVDNKLVGYTSRLIERDLTNYNYMFFHGIDHINFDKLISAYEVMYQNAIRLAQDGISIFDLPYNVLFDGERLIGIDTCGYTKKPSFQCGDNPNSVDEAVKRLFIHYAKDVHGDTLDTNVDTVSFLKMVHDKYSSCSKHYVKTYFKK